ncbi:transposable element Tcb2 transposase [Trichonephila clavipes]|nr:transposable element Tcb2 transposase [Trichonephila clavipes]
MTAQWYVHDILQPHELSLHATAPRSHFQQDNARSHTARPKTVPQRYYFPWLYPIARFVSNRVYIWDHLERQFGHPTSLNELEARLQQIWNKMSEDIIQNSFASMLDRIAS